MMFFTLIFGLLVIYLLAGALLLLALDMEMRQVCRRTWSSRWCFFGAVCIWPLFIAWMNWKWRRWRLKSGW